MDPLRSAHTPQPPAQQPTTFSSSTSTLVPSSNLNSTVSQSADPFNPNLANAAAQSCIAPPPIAAYAAQSTMSQTQPLPQSFSNPAQPTSIPFPPQGNTSESLPRPDAPPATEQAAEVYPNEGNGLGGPTATAPFLQDFSLVAEAAKRAQMSIVMRDLESVTL
ncbi:hypothetical protein PENSTE_c029G03416 [Penicillium steckii]|uniref:Uncharacterized protein n=1 Tax=Penicillium steckii TaxID=303698 RepID=A0A1V6SNK3_9EURO|nr:hypothetical protein PENSTE_c029G03416 [Penicillium steckii]